MSIEAVLFQPGVHSTPELSVAVRRPDGSVINRPVRPIEIEVASVLASGANELKDIRPQAEVPFPTTWPWMFGGLTGALALILLGVYFWRRMLTEASVQAQQILTPLEHALLGHWTESKSRTCPGRVATWNTTRLLQTVSGVTCSANSESLLPS